MRLRLLALLAFAVLSAGCALPRQDDADVSEIERGSRGFVERVSHSADPAGEGRVLVRLDNGFALDACAGGEGFEPGERVRILRRPNGPRAARE